MTVVVEGAIEWIRKHHADIWATQTRTEAVAKFPPNLAVWGPLADAQVWRSAGIQFYGLPGDLEGRSVVMGPGGVPRPGGAFFGALELACASLHAKKVRIFGAYGWVRKDVRWKRWALAHAIRIAGGHGIEIQRAS